MDLKQVLEAILFASQHPLSAKELRDVLAQAAQQEGAAEETKSFAKTSVAEIQTALDALREEYEQMGRSFRLVCVAGAWHFASLPEYAPWIGAKLGPRPRPTRLSQPALETLAIIAYRQPITRADIEQIRGVSVDGVMQTLMERGLVEQVGRAEVPGRPALYGTTKAFLEYFGLASLDDLPAAQELRGRPVGSPAGAAPSDPGLATAPPEALAQADSSESSETGASTDAESDASTERTETESSEASELPENAEDGANAPSPQQAEEETEGQPAGAGEQIETHSATEVEQGTGAEAAADHRSGETSAGSASSAAEIEPERTSRLDTQP